MRAARLAVVAVLSLVVIGSCTRATAPSVAPPTPAPGCGYIGPLPTIDCAAFPNTTPVLQPEWDYFAWNSFIAANWPAVDPAANNQQRGFPDLTKKFVNAAPNDLLVWETFKEKREVFFYPPGTTTNPGPWNQAPNYGPVGGVPLCSDSAGKSPAPRRLLGQGSKLVYDSLDETIEVLSEARETNAQLCGMPDPPCDGSANQPSCCFVKGLAVGPRVWKGNPKTSTQPVLYEVKVNYDFYDFVVDNQLYIDANAAAAAANAIQLPYRTSAASGPSGNNPMPALGYDAKKCMEYDATLTPTSNLTPCPAGSIHLKAAWMRLENEDPSRYHTAEAAYFKTENGKRCMAYDTFALIGLHIIQRIHRGSGTGSAQAPGGTFVFATWEHVDNDMAGFTYANSLPQQPHFGKPHKGFYPPIGTTALPVKRKFPILPGTQRVNQFVHGTMRAYNPNSVWLNYQLIGVQFQPIDVGLRLPPENPNDPTGIGQPLYLANTVIETNDGLQHFQGLPPNTYPVNNFSKEITPNKNLFAFNRNTPNTSFQRKGHNMGGCMGCHGVAQTKGYSFSFVLLGGQRGADVDTQTQFDIPPPSTSTQ